MKRNVFSVLFYIKRTKVNRSGESPIMVSLNVNGDREMFAAKLSVKPDIWDAKSGRAIGRTAAINELNSRLTDIQMLLKRHFYDLEQQQGYATAEQVKNAYMGITAKQESLMPIYREFLEETKKMIGIKKSQKTYDKYERCYRRVVEFMKKKYNSTDIPLRELKPKFLNDFEVFLTTDYGCCQNTTYKFLQLFRMVILKAQRDGVNFPDPYLNFTMKKEKVDRGYLNEEEVIKIATKPITLQRLDQVRDVSMTCVMWWYSTLYQISARHCLCLPNIHSSPATSTMTMQGE